MEDAAPKSGFHQSLFKFLHGTSLVYNATWEDPRIDRELLKLEPDSEVVAITSAGCNILDMLLDSPSRIHAVDLNPRQNHLLELKMALLAAGDFDDLFQFFGIGSHPRRRQILTSLAGHMTPEAASYWRRHAGAFSPHGLRPSFYWRGTAGLAAWSIWRALGLLPVNLRNLALALFEAPTLEEQLRIYGLAEPHVWQPWMNRFLGSGLLMSLVAVPPSQTRLIVDSHPGGLPAYIRDKFRHVMTAVPAKDNYFWRVYTTGSYTLDCCPNYLRIENMPRLAESISRIACHTDSISGFLRSHPGRYSHFVLLDHQDWLAWRDPSALLEEWNLILANSRPGARILLRSAGPEVDFIPGSVRARLAFHSNLTRPAHLRDRVGTYGSVHLAEVL